MLHRWPAVDYAVSDLTGPRFEPQIFRYTYEGITARPTGRYKMETNFFNVEKMKILQVSTCLAKDRAVLYARFAKCANLRVQLDMLMLILKILYLIEI